MYNKCYNISTYKMIFSCGQCESDTKLRLNFNHCNYKREYSIPGYDRFAIIQHGEILHPLLLFLQL